MIDRSAETRVVLAPLSGTVVASLAEPPTETPRAQPGGLPLSLSLSLALSDSVEGAPTAHRSREAPSVSERSMASIDSNRGGGNWGPMGVCPGTIMGADCDSVFAYPTIKYVKIQDARLGLFKYFLMFSILLYGEWSGVAWSGVEWRGVAWRGVAWSGVEWSGVE